MSKTFYTSVRTWGGKILYRGFENGRRITKRENYSPSIFFRPNKSDFVDEGYTSLDEKPLARVGFSSISDCREFIKSYKDVSNFGLFGNKNFENSYIVDKFKGEVDFDESLLRVFVWDIECKSESGFPEPTIADQEVTAITIKVGETYHMWGCMDFTPHKPNIVYNKCENETKLLESFIDFWSSDYPDIVTGWNCQTFDNVYIINRIKNVLGDDQAKRLSPWGVVLPKTKKIMFGGQPRMVSYYDIYGVSDLDYITLFKKFSPVYKQESYTLNHISSVILGERKLSYEEYGNLRNLYRDNPQLFMEYNFRDVELVDKIDKKLRLLRLALMLAYDAKANHEDVFSQVRIWTQISYGWLLNKKKIVIPLTHEISDEDSTYEGAYVKEPIPGLKYDLASIDAKSLYPSIIQCYNISPETLIRVDPVYIETMINEMLIVKDDLTFCGNGARFRKDKQGFFGEMVDHYMKRRDVAKSSMIAAEKLREKVKKNTKEYKELSQQIEMLDARQASYKVSLNSLYGGCGSKYFVFYDERLAKAITITGQVIIRHMEKYMNEYLNKLGPSYDYCAYSDTDSIYFELKPIIDKFFPGKVGEDRINLMDKLCKETLQPKIEKTSTSLAKLTNAYRNGIIFKREVLAPKGLWTAKKRYILNVWDKEGVRYPSPKIKVTGLETKKSSTPMICKTKLGEVIEIIMNKDENDLINYIKAFRSEYESLNVEDIARPSSIQGLKTYFGATKSVPIHVRGALTYNEQIKKLGLEKKFDFIKDGEQIRYLHLKEPNIFQSHVLAFIDGVPEEFDIRSVIDYEEQFEKTFLKPIKMITDSIGWKTERKANLKSFFSGG